MNNQIMKRLQEKFHDFQYNGRIFEVKTTMTKEPRRVRINNEGQLDNKGVDLLYLFILTLQKLDSKGQKLTKLVDKIRAMKKGDRTAVQHVPAGIRERYPNIPWKDIAGMRDKVIYAYFGVDYEVVWNTIHEDIPYVK